jgi:hypothetical protein
MGAAPLSGRADHLRTLNLVIAAGKRGRQERALKRWQSLGTPDEGAPSWDRYSVGFVGGAI